MFGGERDKPLASESIDSVLRSFVTGSARRIFKFVSLNHKEQVRKELKKGLFICIQEY